MNVNGRLTFENRVTRAFRPVRRATTLPGPKISRSERPRRKGTLQKSRHNSRKDTELYSDSVTSDQSSDSDWSSKSDSSTSSSECCDSCGVCVSCLLSKADELLDNYEESKDKETLTQAIELCRQALDLSSSDKDKMSSMDSLASALTDRFELTLEADALSEAVGLYRSIIDIQLPDDPDGANTLSSLADTLMLRYEHFSDVTALEEGAHLHKVVLKLVSLDDPDNTELLSSAATAFFTHFEYNSDLDMLSQADALYRNVLELLPLDDSKRASSLSDLAYLLRMKYESQGGREKLEESIALQRKSLELRPPGNAERSECLDGLGMILLSAYYDAGSMDTLAECISLHREGLEIGFSNPVDRGLALGNLAAALRARFEYTDNPDDLEEIIELLRECIKILGPADSYHAMTLSDLGNALVELFYQDNRLETLDEAIRIHRESLGGTPISSPFRYSALTGLADALTMYGEETDHTASFYEAIKLGQEAVESLQSGHPFLVQTLLDLSDYYDNLFDATGDNSAVMNALIYCQQALDVILEGDPWQASAHHSMACLLLRSSPYFNWRIALGHIFQAVSNNYTTIRHRLQWALHSLEDMEDSAYTVQNEHDFLQSALEIYVAVIRLLPQVAHLGLDLSARLRELLDTESLCRNAAARAAALSRLEVAVEVIEEGKSVFWSQALQLRSPDLDTLPTEDKMQLLEFFSTLEEGSFASENIENKALRESSLETRRKLSEQAYELLERIRSRPGFDRFLMLPQFDQLIAAADSGPVVMLIDSQVECLAIILNPKTWPERARAIPLKSLTSEKLDILNKDLVARGLRGSANLHRHKSSKSTRGMAISRIKRQDVHVTLEKLWHKIVHPIVEALDLKKADGRERPRVHWCPTGDFAFLPLHAAGVYHSPNTVSTSDYIVSSYIPSLFSLLKTREGYMSIPRGDLRALLVAESNAPNFPPLTSVREEVDTVTHLMASSSVTIINNPSDCTDMQSVTEALPTAHILHLACHGIQMDDNPLNSHFALGDGNLTIAALMRLKLSHPTLAFLSACETAKGGKDQPDQAVHLAASMLFCGFRSVIATMWGMYDQDGPQIARWVYESLLSQEKISLDDIPYALDEAVQKLRQNGASAQHWATFMHIGG